MYGQLLHMVHCDISILFLFKKKLKCRIILFPAVVDNWMKKVHRLCPYLDTINRQVLDFDFEKLCSISLSRINVYACLVCGKYFQGNINICVYGRLFGHVPIELIIILMCYSQAVAPTLTLTLIVLLKVTMSF